MLLLVPSFKFVINSKLNSSQSIFDLIKNSWSGSREYLFSATAQTTPQGTAMYRAIFITLIVLILLFLIGVAINIFSMIVSYREIFAPKENTALKNAYLAFIPNRILLSSFRTLVIPIFFLPDAICYFYRTRLSQSVSAKYTLIHPAIVAILLFLATLIITAIAKKYEVAGKQNIFEKKSLAKQNSNASKDNEEYVPTAKLYRMESGTDTTERLRKMFEDTKK